MKKLRLAAGTLGLAAAGLIGSSAWATCEFTAPTARTAETDSGWGEGVSATSGDLIVVQGTSPTLSLPAVADLAACDGDGRPFGSDALEGRRTADGCVRRRALLTLLTLMDGPDGGTASAVTVATGGTDDSSLSNTGASVTYSPA